MKVSLNWLKQYVEARAAATELADGLTMAGLEVEAVEPLYAHLSTVVVARIQDVAKHPNADKLTCCTVDVGNKTIQIICGAPNAKAGLKVPCALPGTVLPAGVTVKKAKIRGQQSEGMLCSEAELDLGDDASGLMVLSDAHQPGTPLSTAFNLSDTVFEIGLTPNRPDCLSHIGVAREVAALWRQALTPPTIDLPSPTGQIADFTSVTIQNPELCPRYAARMVIDIAVGPSPTWLQGRLRAVGLKPINNIVDITNYVMMETGQPLHAFDFDRLDEHRIVVRTPAGENKFTTLDGKERILDAETLLICDGKKPVAIGGVMGGENSEIMEDTTRVLIESAYFDPISIRKTAKRLTISTDASHRFERGVDPDGTLYALNRAAQLIAELGDGRLVDGIIDEHPRPTAQKTIRLSTSRTNRHLGTRLNTDEVSGLLESVEFKVKRVDDDQIEVAPPSFRVDVDRPEDLMEEVARLWGYNRIVTTFPQISARTDPPSQALTLKKRIKDLMSGFGFHEAINYSFTAGSAVERLALPAEDPRRNTVDILNPLSEDQAVMRTTLLPGLLEAMQKNIFRQERNLKLFELGRAFYSTGADQLPHEVEMLTGLWTGLRNPVSWHTKTAPCDFYDIKGVVETLLCALGICGTDYSHMPPQACSYTQPGQTAQIRYGDTFVGLLGEIKPAVLKQFDIKQAAFAFEIHVDAVLPLLRETVTFSPIPKFPAVTRDITLIVDNTRAAGDILRHVGEMGIELVEDAFIFDVYRGDPIPPEKKSISIRIVYRSFSQTLEDEQVNTVHQTITDSLLTDFGAMLPA